MLEASALDRHPAGQSAAGLTDVLSTRAEMVVPPARESVLGVR